jgi:glycogen(starch) synthase
MRTPLVATDVGGTRELALPDVHGTIVPPHDRAALTSAMVDAMNDPAAARRRAEAARERIEHELSFAERTRRLESIYDDVLAEHGRFRARRTATRTTGAQRA